MGSFRAGTSSDEASRLHAEGNGGEGLIARGGFWKRSNLTSPFQTLDRRVELGDFSSRFMHLHENVLEQHRFQLRAELFRYFVVLKDFVQPVKIARLHGEAVCVVV